MSTSPELTDNAGGTALPGPKGPPERIHLNPRAQRIERRITLLTVITPFAGVILAVVLLWGRGVGGTDLILFAVMYAATAIGVGVGFHRLLAHRAFKTTRWVRDGLIILGSMAGQGPALFWTAVHRRHHAHSDDVDDPHSPHHHGEGTREFLRGLWHAHTGWLFDYQGTNPAFYVPDLMKDRSLYQVHRRYFFWLALGLGIPAVAGGLIARSWTGALTGLIWGGLVRMFLLHHATWSINSICHVYGKRPYETRDQSTNNIWLAIPSFGEAWHNNHHAFPSSAMHGLRWWQVDLCGYVIRGLRTMRLAWDVKSPREDAPSTRIRGSHP